MRRSTQLLISVAAAACAGCAGVATQSYPASTGARLALYAEATPCCDDPSGFRFSALPPRGRVLCLAEGEGRNAVWLAQQGFAVAGRQAFAREPARAELRVRAYMHGHAYLFQKGGSHRVMLSQYICKCKHS